MGRTRAAHRRLELPGRPRHAPVAHAGRHRPVGLPDHRGLGGAEVLKEGSTRDVGGRAGKERTLPKHQGGKARGGHQKGFPERDHRSRSKLRFRIPGRATANGADATGKSLPASSSPFDRPRDPQVLDRPESGNCLSGKGGAAAWRCAWAHLGRRRIGACPATEPCRVSGLRRTDLVTLRRKHLHGGPAPGLLDAHRAGAERAAPRERSQLPLPHRSPATDAYSRFQAVRACLELRVCGIPRATESASGRATLPLLTPTHRSRLETEVRRP